MGLLRRTVKNEFWYVLFLVPGFSLFALALLIPLGMGIRYSFTDWDGIAQTLHYIGWSNYKNALTDKDLWKALLNTFKYAIILTIAVNILSLLFALLLDSYLKFRTVFRTVFFLPSVISVVLSGFIWSYNYSTGLPKLFHFFGFDNVTSPLGNPDHALFGIIIIAVWQGIGAPMIIYIAGLQGIPQELIESAKIDGAGTGRTLWNIVLPLLAPSFTINMVLTLTGSLKVFDLVFVTTKGGPAFATEVMSTYIYRSSFASYKGGYGMALSMIFFVVLVIVTIIQLSIFRRREVEN